MVGAELWMDSMTVPEHPSQSIELWQLGLSPDGESSVQTAFVRGKPEILGDWPAIANISEIPTQLQLATLNLRKGLMSSEKPPTDTGLASPGETAPLKG